MNRFFIDKVIKYLSVFFLFTISFVVFGASYIGEEEYPWYMHEVVGDGNANVVIIDNSDYNYSEVLYNNGTGKEYTHLVSEENINYSNPSPSLLTCPGYNLLAYNPELDYAPWKGKDIEGNDFIDYRSMPLSAFSSVKRNPYFSVSDSSTSIWNYSGYWDMSSSFTSNVEDITTHKYQEWDGIQSAPFWRYNDDCDKIVEVNSLPIEKQGNYANWFAYYRTRRHIQRAIASNIISKVDGPIALNPVTVDYNQQIWAPMVDLTGESENSPKRLALLHLMYHFSEKNSFGDAASGWYRTALASTLQYLQHGGKIYQFNSGHMSNPPSNYNQGYPGAYGDYFNVIVSDSPMQERFEKNPCSIGKILMLSPGISANPSAENGNVVAWGIPCAPNITNIYSASRGVESNCKSGQAGFGDVDSAPDWFSTHYNNAEQKTDYSGGVYAGGPSSAGFNNSDTTLADITMHYYMTDFSKSSKPEYPYIREEGTDPHIVVDMAGFGVSTNRIETGYGGGSGWGDPNSGGASPSESQVIDRIDDLYHAAINARGNFINPQYPVQLVGLISNPGSPYNSVGDWSHYLSKTTGRVAKVEAAYIPSSIAPASAVYDLSDHWYFVGEYTTGVWSGDLKAYHYSPNDDQYGKLPASGSKYVKGNITNEVVWSAEEKLNSDLKDPSGGELLWGSRKIFTIKNDGTGTIFDDSLGTAEKSKIINSNMVDINGNGAADSEDVNNLINYIKGDSSKESYDLFRPRDSLIGDIINSNPTYVDGDTPMIYVGANDGMLHGFNAKNGKEVFAYVPTTIFPDLYKLSLTENFKHRMMVDGAISVYEVEGRKMLFSGLGHGGRGYFSLDITNPNTSATGIVKWEINSSSAGFSKLGYTFAKFKVVEINGTSYGVVANGYDGGGDAVLYLIDLSDGSKIAEAVITGASGLSTPAIVKNGSDVYVYAGAMDGNVYKFKISKTSLGVVITKASNPFFNGSSDQPITVEPTIINYHPGTEKKGVLLAFGTGRYLTKEDHNDGSDYAKQQLGDGVDAPKTQAIYLIGDHDVKDLESGNFGVSALNARSFSESGGVRITDYPLEGEEKNFSIWGKDSWFDGNTGTKRGWYMELSNAERVITKAYMFAHKTKEYENSKSEENVNPTNYQAGVVVFSTLIPGCNECDNATTGWLMALRAYDGKANYMSFDTNKDHILNDKDSVSEKTGGSDKTGYCGIKQDNGEFAVSGFTMVRRLDDKYEPEYDGNNKPDGDNFGTVDLIGVAAGKTQIYNVTLRNNDITGELRKRTSWKELRRSSR